ncbi:MAG TPA: MFS transporter [Bacteroidales bacterium]|nr:MFS transporter [Bacteroidales bacterium]
MNLKVKLSVMNFFQFFVWGAWMMTLAKYAFGVKHWDGGEFGIIFSTMGFASLITPALFGIIADKWVKSNILFGTLHFLFAVVLCFLPLVDNAWTFFFMLLLAMCFYMPTIALNNSIGFELLVREGKNPQRDFPAIRVWGTIGFIAAMWITNFVFIAIPDIYTIKYFAGYSFLIGAFGAVLLSVFTFIAIPEIKPENKLKDSKKLVDRLGLQAFALFKDYKMALFFIFSILLGAALQLTNAYGDEFIGSVDHWFTKEYSTIILSVSQISETLFILSIPFFMRRFGIKKVMLFSMLAWTLRFGLFGVAGPSTLGIVAIFASCIIYGMAFDFFNISGALFVENTTSEKIRNSAQGVFMMMTNGVGAVAGNITAGYLIKFYYTDSSGVRDWAGIWMLFASYALVVAILFAVLFRYKHNPSDTKLKHFAH